MLFYPIHFFLASAFWLFYSFQYLVLKQAALVRERKKPEEKSLDLNLPIKTDGTTNWDLLNEAYDRCGEVCAEYAKTFYLGTFSFLFSFFLCFIGSDLLSYYPCLFYDKGIVFFDYFFLF